MISDREVRQACHQEHRMILYCYQQWNTEGHCSGDLWRALQHHHMVLAILRDYLKQQYQVDWHH